MICPRGASLAPPEALEIAARKLEFAETIQSDLGGPVPREKIFLFPSARIDGYLRAVPYPPEGRFAIVTDVGHGMRWTR